MLDGIHAVFQCHPDAFRGFHMGCHHIAGGVGFVADGFHHLRCHLQFTWHALFLGVQNASGNHQFHQVYFFLLRLL